MKILMPVPVGESIREAIPVRAIQFALGWRHPMTVARELANIGDKDWPHGLPVLARRWDDEGQIGEVPVHYWKALSAPLNTRPANSPSPIEAARRLPAGVFLWRHDFEKAFNHVLAGYPTPGLKLGPSGFGFLFDPEPGDVPREVIMEGFEHLATIALSVTVSLPQAGAILKKRLGASDFEIRWWILGGRIQAYRHHRFRGDDRCSKAEPWRYDPDRGGPELDAGGEPRIYPARRFLREEVEGFDPSGASSDDWKPSSYPEFAIAGAFESDDPSHHGFNPSGRFVSLRQAVAFLGGLGNAEDVVEALRAEVADERIWAYEPGIDESLPEDSCFAEAQILGWAATHYGRPFDGWDAITRPRRPGPISDNRAELERARLRPEASPLPIGPALGEPDSAREPERPMNRARLILEKILDELERYAKVAEVPFDRMAMPGPLGEGYQDESSFHWLCGKLHPVFMKARTTFEKHRAGLCATQRYAKPTNFYREALPHIAPMFPPKGAAQAGKKTR